VSYRYIEPRLLLNQTVSGTTVATSTVHDMRTLPRGAIEINYGSGLNATIAIYASVSGINYKDMGLNIDAIAGSAGMALVDLTAFGAAYYKAVITPTSGSAAVTVYGCAKGA
jgi:hypothetical protein